MRLCLLTRVTKCVLQNHCALHRHSVGQVKSKGGLIVAKCVFVPMLGWSRVELRKKHYASTCKTTCAFRVTACWDVQKLRELFETHHSEVKLYHALNSAKVRQLEHLVSADCVLVVLWFLSVHDSLCGKIRCVYPSDCKRTNVAPENQATAEKRLPKVRT